MQSQQDSDYLFCVLFRSRALREDASESRAVWTMETRCTCLPIPVGVQSIFQQIAHFPNSQGCHPCGSRSRMVQKQGRMVSDQSEYLYRYLGYEEQRSRMLPHCRIPGKQRESRVSAGHRSDASAGSLGTRLRHLRIVLVLPSILIDQSFLLFWVGVGMSRSRVSARHNVERDGHLHRFILILRGRKPVGRPKLLSGFAPSQLSVSHTSNVHCGSGKD